MRTPPLPYPSLADKTVGEKGRAAYRHVGKRQYMLEASHVVSVNASFRASVHI